MPSIIDRFSLGGIKTVYDQEIKLLGGKGIDRISPDHFEGIQDEQFKIIQKKCLSKSYKFAPYLEKLQLKGRGKSPRLISIATIRDRIVLTILKEILHDIFSDCVNRKLPNTYIKDIKEFYKSRGKRTTYFLKTDIKSFFDEIDHKILLKAVEARITDPLVFELIRGAIKNPTVPVDYHKGRKKEYIPNKGVPQGGAISNILADIYLNSLDKKISLMGLRYFRYVDDILLFFDYKQKAGIKRRVIKSFDEINLTLNLNNKTKMANIKDGFDYLGYHLKSESISVRQPTVERFIKSIAALFTSYSHHSGDKLKRYNYLSRDIVNEIFLSDLNEKITGAISEKKRYGWLFYFLEINDIKLLYRLDKIIYKFFQRTEVLKKITSKPKSMVRAYHEAKHTPLGGYIHNYNIYDTIPKKMEYIKYRLDPPFDPSSGRTYSPEDITKLYNHLRERHLKGLEIDLGRFS